MASIDEKRYYWLKLDKDFFKRHDIRIVEAMKNGKDYILFYLKLLCESTSHEGYLRFSPTIPYSEEMLSTVTDTNIDTVRAAVKIFTTLGMMTRLDDGTLYLEQVEKMIGSESGAALRMRNARAKAKEIGTNGNIQEHCSQELEIDKELELEKDMEKEKERQKLIETDRSDSQSRRITPSLGYGLAKVLSNAGYIDESEIVIDQYDELINSWLADDGKTVRDLRTKIGYFLGCYRRGAVPTISKYCYFKTAMESSFRKDDSQEAFAKMMEELNAPSDDDGNGVTEDDE